MTAASWLLGRSAAGASARGRPRRAAVPARRELLAVAAALAALGAAAFGAYVVRGGLYWDDWENAATTMHPPSGFLGPIDLRLALYRPVLAVLLPLPHELAGDHPAPQLAIGIALTVAMVWCFYLVLRTAGLATRHAGPIAALTLLFPYSTATRLWPTGAVNNVAVALYLLGLCAGLRALDADGERRRRLGRTAIVLYVVGVLTYEAVALPALASVAVYALARGWRPALAQWRREVPFVVGATLLVGVATTRRVESIAGAAGHAVTIATEGVALLARSLVPFVTAPVWAVAAGLAVAGALSIALERRLAADDARRAALRRGWALVGIGAVAAAVAYGMFVPAPPTYAPLHGGTADRINLLAALAFAVLAYGAALVLGGLAAATLPRARLVGPVVSAMACLLVAAGWAVRLVERQGEWERASALQREVLRPLARGAAQLPRGSTVYSFGHPRFAAPGVPVFATSWDLNGAVRATTGDPTLSAYPLGRHGRLWCEANRPGPTPTINNAELLARYGRAFLLDVASGRLLPIASRASCRALNRRLAAGALLTGPATGTPPTARAGAVGARRLGPAG